MPTDRLTLSRERTVAAKVTPTHGPTREAPERSLGDVRIRDANAHVRGRAKMRRGFFEQDADGYTLTGRVLQVADYVAARAAAGQRAHWPIMRRDEMLGVLAEMRRRGTPDTTVGAAERRLLVDRFRWRDDGLVPWRRGCWTPELLGYPGESHAAIRKVLDELVALGHVEHLAAKPSVERFQQCWRLA